MVQTIQVTVPIPDDHIIISKAEYKELVDSRPVNMTLQEVADMFPCSKQWFKENVLDNDYFRSKIESFSTFPTADGKGHYKFDRKEMMKFLKQYNKQIHEYVRFERSKK
ncbi:DUF771 domain-containing protein [Staphylococcus chromogenes]|uniref:DUF771 domain-containing protein n=1 Tax=Staphylococcus TaxID=1279 RepID=UPI0014051537|nr:MULTISPECIES: DUF771 domain-containing protein [Staphylococcus]MDG4944619.1 DUF771 domain-containing protein [Staphylococcus agnetis]QIN26363.1 DUF771 domain-containing protein [Staphylococcus chromogenes]